MSDLSFTVGAGETVALVGESGSGKSVTALAIMGLLPASVSRRNGRIRLGGVDLAALPDRALRKIRGNEVAMIFQEPMTSLNPVRTIGFQIAEVADPAPWHVVRRGACGDAAPAGQGAHTGGRARASTTIRIASPAACASA